MRTMKDIHALAVYKNFACVYGYTSAYYIQHGGFSAAV